jgi:hypothetical protein
MSIIFVFYFLPFPFFSSHLFLSFYYSMSLSSFVTVLFCLPLYSLHCPILSYVTCRPPAMGAARAELAGRHILQLCRPGRRWSALSTGNEDRGATWHCDGGVLTVITINLRSSFVLGLTQTGMVRGSGYSQLYLRVSALQSGFFGSSWSEAVLETGLVPLPAPHTKRRGTKGTLTVNSLGVRSKIRACSLLWDSIWPE